MKVSSRWMVSALAAAALAGCGAEDPARFGRPPVVSSFDPASQHLTAFVGDTLQFSLLVTDPDGDRVRTSFAIDGKARGVGSPWTYVVSDTGSVTVRGSVTDGEFVSYIDWLVEGLEPIDLPPVIENYQPVERNPTLIVGKRMTFAVVARDPEAMPLTYSFTVNDSLVAQSRQFEYLARSVGAKLVRATVSDGEYTVAHAWNLRVTAVPDTIPPAVVVITAAGTGAEPGEIYLEWIAVGKDGMVGMPSQYQVRTAPDPFSSEEEWERGSQRQGVPAPAAPGETMSMTIGGLLPARTTHVTVRAVDDFGNISPLGQSPSAVTRGMRISGTVVDAISGQPVPNALVRLGTFTAVTGADGSWRL